MIWIQKERNGTPANIHKNMFQQIPVGQVLLLTVRHEVSAFCTYLPKSPLKIDFKKAAHTGSVAR